LASRILIVFKKSDKFNTILLFFREIISDEYRITDISNFDWLVIYSICLNFYATLIREKI